MIYQLNLSVKNLNFIFIKRSVVITFVLGINFPKQPTMSFSPVEQHEQNHPLYFAPKQKRFLEACKKGDLAEVEAAVKDGAQMIGLGLGLAAAACEKKDTVFDWLLQNKCPVDGDTWLYSHVYGMPSIPPMPGFCDVKITPEELTVIENRAKLEIRKIFATGHPIEIARNWALTQGNQRIVDYIDALNAHRN